MKLRLVILVLLACVTFGTIMGLLSNLVNPQASDAVAPVQVAHPFNDPPDTTTTTTVEAAPFDPHTYVNGLEYRTDIEQPVATSYVIVATTNGWTPERIEAWAPFILAVIHRESKGCPNVRYGARLAPNGSCTIMRQGTGSAAGFGQFTRINYGPGRWLCTDHGVCSTAAIVDDPWTSMAAVVWAIDRSGPQPWCYTTRLRASPTCRLAPS